MRSRFGEYALERETRIGAGAMYESAFTRGFQTERLRERQIDDT